MLVVHSRNAWRSYRTQAAPEAQQGLQLFTIEQLAARLAGGFFQPIDPDDMKTAVGEALATSLGELDSIKALPGFQEAAAATLAKAWTAGLDLAEEMAAASDPTATARLDSLAALETEVLALLLKSQLRPHDLVTAALKRVCHAPTLFWIERKIGCLPVLETGRVVGILTEAEIVQSICDGSQPPTLSKLRGSCSC